VAPEKFQERTIRVGLISLGCAKNLVDAEIILGALLKDGMEIINDPAQADVVIVNTCSFIDSAQEESVDTILESAELREVRNRAQGLIVAGCLPQRFRGALPGLLPEVDAFMGIDQVAQVASIVRRAIARRATKVQSPKSDARGVRLKRALSLTKLEAARRASEKDSPQSPRGTDRFGRTKTVVTRAAYPIPRNPDPQDKESERGREDTLLAVHSRPHYLPDFATPRLRLTPRHFAYLKIAEGCNHPCSFCIIPRVRGSYRSRRQSDIVEEARQLIASGVKELNLISQDSTYYGLDLRPDHRHTIASPERFSSAFQALAAGTPKIDSLLRELNALPGDFWIRLLYTHPAHWTDELIQTIAECPKVARYVDIPLQHIHENMLERMRRETSPQYIRNLLRRIRAGIPGIVLRTTFIVGFPGETEACFETLLDFLREAKFERLGVFTYSEEEGTRAGGMAGQISGRIKQQRRDRAMAVQRDIAVRVSHSFVGRTLRVLVEGIARAKQLDAASVNSWEHGLIRDAGSRGARPGTGRLLIARGEADAPDIDGVVYLHDHLPIGQFAQVNITGHTDYDLIAVPA
jgi:ribosomal protein S12 methylthiotransferase